MTDMGGWGVWMPDVWMRTLCIWRPQEGENHSWAARASMELSWAATGSAPSHVWLCFPALMEEKPRTFIPLNCILRTMMSASGARLAVDLEGSSWSAKMHLPSLGRTGGQHHLVGPWESRSSCAWSKHTELIQRFLTVTGQYGSLHQKYWSYSQFLPINV